ncbi:MAG: hypothetical protein DMD99_17030 [Candidatus Rokuibacteriota bacterium]|nr:MAG: hypothetical protein DMD99_17030 [Candidatus Rokubacteria bacterium]
MVPYRLRVGEGQAERRCDHEANKRPFDEGPAHYCNLISAETLRKRLRQRLDALRVQEKKRQVEPDLAVMARLKDEMAFPLWKELCDLLLHLPTAYTK